MVGFRHCLSIWASLMNSTPSVPVKRSERHRAGDKHRDAAKLERIPVKVIPTEEIPRQPEWLRSKLPISAEVNRIKKTLSKNSLSSVCEEASCPNLGECFANGTATFMIMGDICTRRCPFCDVGHGKPKPLDPAEPEHLARAVADMGLRYVVITSVDRDDLRDGGAGHFTECIEKIRNAVDGIQVEILTPDFRGRMDIALEKLLSIPPDVFNHNLETVPRLYRQSRPGANYQWSLTLLQKFKEAAPLTLSKSGLMVGLGEEKDEIFRVMDDMREHQVDMLTIGQYLQPSRDHLAVQRFVHPDEFEEYRVYGEAIGFKHVASGPLVRSSYHADVQAKSGIITAL